MAPFLIIVGLLALAYPFLGPRLRAYFEPRCRLTASTFYKTQFDETTAIPLHEGRVVVRYRKAWLELSDGPDIALTPQLPEDETHRFFAAIRQARVLREGRTETPQ